MKTKRISILSASCVLLAAVALPAQATLVSDNYEGASGNAECMGANYCISDANVTRSGNTLTVSINTIFAGLAGTTFNPATVGGLGIGYGDLFLASSWDPFGSAPYASDDASTGTLWTYGLAFSTNSDRFVPGTNNGTATLYTLNSGVNTTDALLSEDFMLGTFSQANYRNGQEVAVDTSAGDVTSVANGTWSVVNGSTVSFSIDLTGTDLENTAVAFHWGMTCGNDVIEGEIGPPSAIPVPASIWLMGSGLVGLISIARRRKQA
jgi:hypothetical protein